MEQQSSQHQRVVDALKTKINALGNKLVKDAYYCAYILIYPSYNALKKRRDLEVEGFTNDISNLRQQVKKLEKQIVRFGPVEDKELQFLEKGILRIHFNFPQFDILPLFMV
jgi:hypothetical protein